MYNQGFSVKEIANNLEISESTIRRDIEKLVSSGEIVKRPKSNVKKTENKPKLKEKRGIEDPKLRKKVVGLVQKGYSTKQMAKRLGVSRASVCNYIKRLKEDGLIPYADREVATSEQLERENKQIVQWYRQAVPAKEIADNLGLTLNSVYCRVYEIRQKGELPPFEELKEERKKNRAIRIKLIKFIQSEQELFLSGKVIDDSNIERISKAVKILGYRKQDVNFLLRVYIKKGKFLDGVKLLESYSASKNLPHKEKIELVNTQNILRREEIKRRGLDRNKIKLEER